METTVPNSPLSARPAKKVRELSQAFILDQLERYYGETPPSEIVAGDYSIWECSETGLQFAQPMRGGSAGFYQWVSRFESYYPGQRWEYHEVARMIEPLHASHPKVFKLLDVGAGKGDFLAGLNSIPTECKFALDLNQPAVEACQRLGFRAFCGTIQAGIEAGFFTGLKFSAVTSFHCLEHVEQPVEFARALASVAVPGGRIFLSTPYSPMSFEADWFDILNHPPHHLTRWNLAAYQRLAAMLGWSVRYFTPPSPAWRRTLNVFRLLHYGPNRPVPRARLLKDLVRRFPEFLHLYQRQRRHTRANGVSGADAILVEFTVP